MGYNSTARPGTRSSTSPNPKSILEDIDQKIHVLDPEAVPLQVFGEYIGRGAPPRSHKIQVKHYHAFDHFDFASSVYMGNGSGTAGEEVYARLTLDQPSRPDLSDIMFYHPQDKFYIVSTGQTVEVSMTPTEIITTDDSGTTILLSTNLTDGTTSTTATGTVVVKNIEPAPLIPFSSSYVIFMGRTISESQPIQATSTQRDCLYDCNYVEHKERVLVMTEDQRYMIEMEGKVPDWTFQQEETLRDFKKDVEYNCFFGERAVEFVNPTRPKRHMRGLVNAIESNVAYWNPSSTVDMENLFGNFMFESAFRYNPNGFRKIALCGGRFLHDFNMSFREYRRTDTLAPKAKDLGLNFETYFIPGGFELTLMRSEVLRQNTPLENWCFVVDPLEAEWRVKKDYESRLYSLPSDRDLKYMVEWQGSIAWHLEQSHALLRTSEL